MVSLLLALRRLARAVAAVWRDPETKALSLVVALLVLTGTIFYWRVEDWTIIEALYFSVTTVTTVGFGDFSPTTPEAQIFTIIYILTGVGVLVAFLSAWLTNTSGREPRDSALFATAARAAEARSHGTPQPYDG